MTDDLISRAAALAECQKISDDAKAYSLPQMAGGANACREAIRALPAVVASQSVRVKPLVWKGDSIRVTANGRGKYYSCMRMFHGQKGAGWECDEGDWHPTLDAAKGIAQADYEKRILAAIEPQPDPRDAVIVGLVEALAFYADESTYETQYERMPCDCCTDIFEPINDDKGSKARAAIAAAKAIT